MTKAAARHLLSRTGYSPTMRELESFAKLEPAARADKLLKSLQREPTLAQPSWAGLHNAVAMHKREAKASGDQEKLKAIQREQKQRSLETVFWWYQEMIKTKSPMTERLVLFWHNHFTSSLQKVKYPQLMLKQNALFRRLAAGNFGALLLAICQDPAMILYLDNQTNRKAQPNENFARELLELFTLGEGHYAEADIKEAARAFTGWQVDRQTGLFTFNQRQHDKGLKLFLGERGHWGGEDIVRILLKQPRVAAHIVERLWLELIDEQPQPQEVERLAKLFRGADYELKPLLKAILTSPAFLDTSRYGAQIKSPVELIVGVIRLFEIPLTEPKLIVHAGRTLGQVPFYMPSVKGWPRFTEWITTDTLATRQQLIHRVFRDEENVPMLADGSLKRLLGAHKPQEAIQRSIELMLPTEPVYPPAQDLAPFELIRHLALDPAFQLK